MRHVRAGVVQQIQLLIVTTASHVGTSVWTLALLLLIELPTEAPGRQHLMAWMFGPCHQREKQMEFLVIWEVNQQQRKDPLFVFLSLFLSFCFQLSKKASFLKNGIRKLLLLRYIYNPCVIKKHLNFCLFVLQGYSWKRIWRLRRSGGRLCRKIFRRRKRPYLISEMRPNKWLVLKK